MRTLTFTAQKFGINRNRVKGGARVDQLYDLLNGYVTGAKTVVPREGTIRDAIVPTNTKGLTAFQNLLHVFSDQVEDYLPVGYLANVLAHPTDDDATLVKIHFAEPFMGALYVVAEWSDGGIYHYWLGYSGVWEAEKVYYDGDVVIPTVANGLLYKATANNPDAPTQTWQALKNYTLGDKVLPTTANGFYFQVTATQGDVPISGASEPAWNATEGAETTESTDSTGAPASSTQEAAGPEVPPDIRDRYGTGNTALSESAAAAAALSDTVPVWAPGTLYQPGALVRPLSAAPVINSAIPNAGFESGDTAWTKGTGWTITNAGSGSDGNKPYQGAWFAKFDMGAIPAFNYDYHYLEMATKVPVVPGQFVSASCYESRDADETRSRIFLRWYDQYDVLIKETAGQESESNKSKDYRVFVVQDSTPGGATKLSVAFGCKRSELVGGEGTVAVDSFVWDYVNLTPAEADFTVYQAVQAAAATSGTSEPAWPGPGLTVVDGGVTWLGGVTSVITWTAVPIMKSGTTEPTWAEQPGAATPDNTISWVATTGYVEEAPNSKIVRIAAKKVFAGDDDILRYSATVNPLDWTSAEDAGYLPTGLNPHGANPIAALAPYRGNLIPFNSAGFQMWQVDPDPRLMGFLDAIPVGSTYHLATQPVKNDLAFLTNLGVRSVGIASGSTNLKAADLGEPIDPLVVAAIRDGSYEPFSLFYPARNQYWLVFGPQVFVATFNDDGPAWSRYEFPEALTDATLLDEVLYLRTETGKVWEFSAAALADDIFDGVQTALLLHFDEGYVYGPSSNPAVDSSGNDNAVFRGGASGAELPESQSAIAKFAAAAAASTNGDYLNCASPGFNLDAEVQWSVEAWVYAAATLGGTFYVVRSADNTTRLYLDGAHKLTFRADGADLIAAADALPAEQWVHVCVCRDDAVVRLFQDGQIVGEAAISTTTWGSANLRFMQPPTLSEGGVPAYVDELRIIAGEALFTGAFIPPTEPYSAGSAEGIPFDGVLWWPALDAGAMGQDKQMDAFDLVVNGEVTVQFGYDQRDPTVLTDGYLIDGDTLPGTAAPFPMQAPSFAPKLTFTGGQAWEWFGFNIYLQDARGAGFAG